MRQSPDADRGAGTVAAITLCFVFMAGGLLWLSRTVDQSLDDRTNANSIAFQASRAGAQALDVEAARRGDVVIDARAARSAAAAVVSTLLGANGDSGSMTEFRVDGATVTVSVVVTTTGRPATGTASATAVRGIDGGTP